MYKYGPLKPEQERGLEETLNLDKDIEEKYKPPIPKMPERVGTVRVKDPSNHRIGWTFDSETVNKRLEEIKEIKSKISSDLVKEKKTTNVNELLSCIDMLRAIVYLCYPGYAGLPDWELAKNNLESKEDLLNKSDVIGEYVNYDTVTLWCAGKEYERNKLLNEYVKIDKTKIICKFSVKGSGAPVREAPIDSETQKKMMQIYYKKQEEIKKLEENTEDDYLNSKWADPKNLKNSLYTGNSGVSWKFK